MKYPQGSTVRGLSLGCTAGTLAGNMFCAKAAIELIQRSIHEQDASIWAHWLPYVLLLGAVFFAVSNVAYMTKGLQEYEALFMVTIYEGSMIVSGCLSGAVVLLDLKGLEAWRVFLYAVGVCVIVLGMLVIFKQEARQKSSLAAGKASIEAAEDLRMAASRSLYASCEAGTGEDPGSLKKKKEKSKNVSQCGTKVACRIDGDTFEHVQRRKYTLKGTVHLRSTVVF